MVVRSSVRENKSLVRGSGVITPDSEVTQEPLPARFILNTRLHITTLSLIPKLPNSSTSTIEIDEINSLLTMRMTGPFTSQLPLLIGIEVLTSVSFVLSLLALFAGTSTGSLKQSAIITVQ